MDERKIVNGFFESVRKTFFACRTAGYLPVVGLLNEEGKSSRCVWISKYMIYYVPSIFLSIVFGLVHLHQALYRTGFQDIGGLIFRCFAVVSSVLLIRLCFAWEKMIKEIEEVERLLPAFKNPKRVFKNINRIMLFMLIIGIVNYILQMTLTVRMVIILHTNSGAVSVEKYYKVYNKWLFDNISFNYVTAFVLQFSKLQMMFAFFVVDSLVIVVTLYLMFRFRNFNRLLKIKKKQCENNRNVLWMDLQGHYTRLTRLVKIIDDHFNPFVFLSFLSNLMFTCKSIYDAFQLSRWPSQVTFDWIVVLESAVRMIYLAFRISTVCILTAHIHTLSREPLKLLHTLPASAYNLEVQRLMDQVYNTKITLSGFGFFQITRGTILSMLSTIITYELVLLQLPHIYSA